MVEGTSRAHVVVLEMPSGAGPGTPANVVPLRGAALARYLFAEMKTLTCADHLVVWTADPEVVKLAAGFDLTVLERPLGLGLRSVVETPADWDRHLGPALDQRIGTRGNLRTLVDGRLLLLRADTIEALYDRLLEDLTAHRVFAVYEIAPHLYIEEPQTGDMIPVWDEPGLDRQAYPKLYRRTNVWTHHALRPRTKVPMKELWHRIPWYEAMDGGQEEELGFMEHMLTQRRRASGTHKNNP